MENPIEQILMSNDESFLIVAAYNDVCRVSLYGSAEEKAEEIVEFTGKTIEETFAKLEDYLTKRVEYAFGNAFWQDVQDEEDENKNEPGR